MSQPSDAPGDALLAGLACTALLGAQIAAVATGLWGRASQWLVDHHVLTQDSVKVTIPGAGGAGLDLTRILIVGAILVAATAGGVVLYRAVRRRALDRASRQRNARPASDQLSPDELADVLLDLEFSLARARQALPALPPPGPAQAHAVGELIPALDRLRREILQSRDRRPAS